nr:MAG TPA: hypothetical protein [Caudoviricetes sp.]
MALPTLATDLGNTTSHIVYKFESEKISAY